MDVKDATLDPKWDQERLGWLVEPLEQYGTAFFLIHVLVNRYNISGLYNCMQVQEYAEVSSKRFVPSWPDANAYKTLP